MQGQGGIKLQADRILSVRTDRTVYLCGDIVSKVYPRGEKAGAVFAEAANLASAADGGLNVPELVTVRKQELHWIIETAYAEGKTLKQLMADAPDSDDRLLDDMAELMDALHRSTAVFSGRLTDRLAKDIRAAGLESGIETRLLSYLNALPKGDAPCHCDFVPENLIRTDRGKICILDWEEAAMGNPLADAAFTCLRLILEGKNRDAEIWLKAFCTVSRCLAERVEEWFPVCAAALCRTCLAPCRSEEYRILSGFFAGI